MIKPNITVAGASFAGVFARLDLSADARAEVTRIDRLLAAELGRLDVDPEAVASMVFRAADVVAADASSAAVVDDIFDDDGDWWHFDVDTAMSAKNDVSDVGVHFVTAAEAHTALI